MASETLSQKRRRACYVGMQRILDRRRASPLLDHDAMSLAHAVEACSLTIREWYPVFALPGTERLIYFTLRATGMGQDVLIYIRPSHHKSGRDRIRKRMIADRESYAKQTGKDAILIDKGSSTEIHAQLALWLALHPRRQ